MKRIEQGDKGGENFSESRFFLRGGHIVLLLGFFLGGLFVSFVMGYRAGRSERFDEYSAEELASIPRIVIPDDQRPRQLPGRFVEEVYSKLESGGLETNKNRSERDGDQAKEAPELKPIQVVSVEELPSQEPDVELQGDDVPETLGDLAQKEKEPVLGEGDDSRIDKPQEALPVLKQEDQRVRISAKEPSETLGGLFELGNSPAKVVEEKSDGIKDGVDATSKFIPLKLPPAEGPLQGSGPDKEKTQGVGSVPTSPADESQTALTPSDDKVQKHPSDENKSGKVPSGWYVQLAALEDKSAADELVKKLFANGFQDSHLQAAVVSGKRYYRVLVGPEGSNVLASRLKEQLEREPYVKFKPYLKKIP